MYVRPCSRSRSKDRRARASSQGRGSYPARSSQGGSGGTDERPRSRSRSKDRHVHPHPYGRSQGRDSEQALKVSRRKVPANQVSTRIVPFPQRFAPVFTDDDLLAAYNNPSIVVHRSARYDGHVNRKTGHQQKQQLQEHRRPDAPASEPKRTAHLRAAPDASITTTEVPVEGALSSFVSSVVMKEGPGGWQLEEAVRCCLSGSRPSLLEVLDQVLQQQPAADYTENPGSKAPAWLHAASGSQPPWTVLFMPSKGRADKAYTLLVQHEEEEHSKKQEPADVRCLLVLVVEPSEKEEYRKRLQLGQLMVVLAKDNQGIGWVRNVLLQHLSLAWGLTHFFMIDDNVYQVMEKLEDGRLRCSSLHKALATLLRLPHGDRFAMAGFMFARESCHVRSWASLNKFVHKVVLVNAALLRKHEVQYNTAAMYEKEDVLLYESLRSKKLLTLKLYSFVLRACIFKSGGCALVRQLQQQQQQQEEQQQQQQHRWQKEQWWHHQPWRQQLQQQQRWSRHPWRQQWRQRRQRYQQQRERWQRQHVQAPVVSHHRSHLHAAPDASITTTEVPVEGALSFVSSVVMKEGPGGRQLEEAVSFRYQPAHSVHRGTQSHLAAIFGRARRQHERVLPAAPTNRHQVAHHVMQSMGQPAPAAELPLTQQDTAAQYATADKLSLATKEQHLLQLWERALSMQQQQQQQQQLFGGPSSSRPSVVFPVGCCTSLVAAALTGQRSDAPAVSAGAAWLYSSSAATGSGPAPSCEGQAKRCWYDWHQAKQKMGPLVWDLREAADAFVPRMVIQLLVQQITSPMAAGALQSTTGLSLVAEEAMEQLCVLVLGQHSLQEYTAQQHGSQLWSALLPLQPTTSHERSAGNNFSEEHCAQQLYEGLQLHLYATPLDGGLS